MHLLSVSVCSVILLSHLLQEKVNLFHIRKPGIGRKPLFNGRDYLQGKRRFVIPGSVIQQTDHTIKTIMLLLLF